MEAELSSSPSNCNASSVEEPDSLPPPLGEESDDFFKILRSRSDRGFFFTGTSASLAFLATATILVARFSVWRARLLLVFTTVVVFLPGMRDTSAPLSSSSCGKVERRCPRDAAVLRAGSGPFPSWLDVQWLDDKRVKSWSVRCCRGEKGLARFGMALQVSGQVFIGTSGNSHNFFVFFCMGDVFTLRTRRSGVVWCGVVSYRGDKHTLISICTQDGQRE